MSDNTVSEDCRVFLESLVCYDPTEDEWIIKSCTYRLEEYELIPEIINWTLQFLSLKKCPGVLFTQITKHITEAVQIEYKKCPDIGGNASNQSYDAYKIKLIFLSVLKEMCQKLSDNLELSKFLPTKGFVAPKCVTGASRNTRRYMEDRHVYIDDFESLYDVKDAEGIQTSFYGVFDGHDGIHAAFYSVSHLPYLIAMNAAYPSNPAVAMKNAFPIVDENFLKKCQNFSIKGGSTAVCALLRPLERKLYVGWVGDSKALLVKNGRVMQTVRPHKPDCPVEARRVVNMGGTVLQWAGALRVNGSLQLTRAIGDSSCKPYVCSDPDIVCLELDNDEDFLILACDGLWDYVAEEDVALTVYSQLRKSLDNLEEIATQLIELAKRKGSSDNITVVVVFLKNPSLISKRSWPMATMDTVLENANITDLASSQVFQPTCDDSTSPVPSSEDLSNKSPTIFKDDHSFNTGFVNIANEPFINLKPQSEQKDTAEEKFVIDEQTDIFLKTERMLEHHDIGPETSVDGSDDMSFFRSEGTPHSFASFTHNDFHKNDTNSLLGSIPEKDFMQTVERNGQYHYFNENVYDKKDSNLVEHEAFTPSNEEHKESEATEDIKSSTNDGDSLSELDNINTGDELLKNNGDDVLNEDFEKPSVSESEPLVDNSSFYEIQKDSIELLGDENNSEAVLNQNMAESRIGVLETALNFDQKSDLNENGEDSEDEWKYMESKEGDAEKLTLKNLPINDENMPKQNEFTQSQEPNVNLENLLEPQTLDSFIQEPDKLDQEVEDSMASQLNPEAKEFVPTGSPITTGGNDLPVLSTIKALSHDEVISQSPRKGAVSMENIQIPSEDEFENEILHRPAETNEFFNSNENENDSEHVNVDKNLLDEPYQELNLKEAMHESEKENQTLRDDTPEAHNNCTNGSQVDLFDSTNDILNHVQNLPEPSDEIISTGQICAQAEVECLIATPEYVVDKSELNMGSPFDTETFQTGELLSTVSSTTTDECPALFDMEAPNNSLSTQAVKNASEDDLLKSFSAESFIKEENIHIELSEKAFEHTISETIVQVGVAPQKSTIGLNDLSALVVSTAKHVSENKLQTKSDSTKITQKTTLNRNIKPQTSDTKNVNTKKPVNLTTKKVSGISSAPSEKPKPNSSGILKAAPKSAYSRPPSAPVASKVLADKKTAVSAKPKLKPITPATATSTNAAIIKKTAPKSDELKAPKASSRLGLTKKPALGSKLSSTISSAPAKPRPVSSTTTATAKATTTRPASASTLALRPASGSTLASTAVHTTALKPAISPRSTLASTLRKAEALKSPTTQTSTTTKRTTVTNTTTSGTIRLATLAKPKPTSAIALKKSPQKPSPIKRPTPSNSTVDSSVEVKVNGTNENK